MDFGSSRHTQPNADSYGYAYRDGNSYSYSYSYSYRDGDSYASPHTDTKIRPVPTPTSNPGSETLRQVGDDRLWSNELLLVSSGGTGI